jgi:hypothetical protein
MEMMPKSKDQHDTQRYFGTILPLKFLVNFLPNSVVSNIIWRNQFFQKSKYEHLKTQL